jgi:hypothetical protein
MGIDPFPTLNHSDTTNCLCIRNTFLCNVRHVVFARPGLLRANDYVSNCGASLRSTRGLPLALNNLNIDQKIDIVRTLMRFYVHTSS